MLLIKKNHEPASLTNYRKRGFYYDIYNVYSPLRICGL